MKFTREQKLAMKRDPLAYAKSLKLTELNAVLEELSDRYSEGKEFLSDEAYDIMDDYRWSISKKKKTAKDVGGSKNADIELETPMSSLEKFHTLSPAKQNAFLKGSSYTLSDKEDGISLAGTYDGGVPVLLTTRGRTGLVGKNVSKVLPFLGLPKTIPYKGRVTVRSELTIDRATFNKYFPDDKTGRNTAGGLLNRDVPSKMLKKFRVICYEILAGKGAGKPLNEQLKTLEKWGFDVVPHKVVSKITPEILAAFHDDRKTNAGRDVDGIVVTKNVEYKAGSGYPSHSFAFKINSLASSLVVPVVDVVFEESRLGKITQVVKIDPTIIGGVEVTSFTAHNYEYIERGYSREHVKKNGGKPPYEPRPIGKGALIRVVRSGDVIPYIMEVVKGAKKPAAPNIPFKRKGAFLYAVHEEKSNLRTIKELTHFFTVLEIDGVKQGVVTKLVDAGYDTVKKILTMTPGNILEIPGYAVVSAKALHKNLQTAKTKMTFHNVARGSAAFGEGIGEKRIATLVEAIPDILEIAAAPTTTVEDLDRMIRNVRGFKELATQIAKNFKVFAKFVKRNGISLVAQKKTEVTGSKMDGQCVLFTSVRDKQAADWIIANGGKIASTVKQATLLIVKDKSSSNDKTKEAATRGTPIQTLQDFRKKNGI